MGRAIGSGSRRARASCERDCVPLVTIIRRDCGRASAPLAGEPRGEVAWTRARLVKRVKGGSPGQVTYSGEKVLAVRVETARLERLLRSREIAAGDPSD